MSKKALSTDQLTSDLKAVVRDAEDILEAIGDQATGKAAETKARVKEAIKQAKRTCEELEERALGSAKAADRVIRDHPYETVGIALAAGLIIGILFGRK